MAVKWAIANGNWSATASWNDFTLPVQGDEVYADGKSITINQNIDVLRLSTRARSGGTLGGSFTVNSSGFSITASIVEGGTTTCLTVSLTSGQTINISALTYSNGTFSGAALSVVGGSGSITGTFSYGNRTNPANVFGFLAGITNGTYNIIGNIIGGAGSNSYALSLSNSIINLTGNLIGGSGTITGALSTSNNTVLNMTGNITGSISSSYGLNLSSSTLNLIGNITGGNSSSGIAVIAQNNSTINATGSVSGGSGVSSHGVYTTQNATRTKISGNIFGGTNTSAYGIYIYLTGYLEVVGHLIGRSGSSAYAVLIQNNVNGNQIGSATGSFVGNIWGGSSTNTSGLWLLGADATVVGNVYGGSGSTSPGILAQFVAGLNLTGNVTAFNVGGSFGLRNISSKTVTINGEAFASLVANGISHEGSGALIINGTVSCSGSEGTKISRNSVAGSLTINGNVIGATQGTVSAAISDDSSSTITINGNVTQQNISYLPTTTGGLINISRTATLNVNGNVTGGSVNNTSAIRVIPLLLSTPVRINILGNISNGASTNSPAIDLASATNYNGYCIIVATGSVTGGSQFPAISTARFLDSITITGNITNTSGVMAIYAYKLNISNSSAQTWTLQSVNSTNRALSTSNASNGAPLAKDVRLGLTYGTVGELTGTLAVPTYSRVSVGVAVDDSVGTAVLNVADVGALLAGYVV
jgi:fibronectin-binding autotransporter adhesin